MKLTGERPIEGQTPESLLALHAAGYREVRDRLGEGRVLDLGCGLADGTASLAGPGRVLVGLDYDATTALLARQGHPEVTTVCGDGTALPFADGSFDQVCSSHLIEHFVDPRAHVREIARVLAADGSAIFLTPNAPADFENPYHVHLFEPEELTAMLGSEFASVTVVGLDGDERAKGDFEQRRATAHRLLALDPLGLRHRLPRSWFVALHAAGRRVAYRFLTDRDGGGEPITDASFQVVERIDPTTLVLLAVARLPRRSRSADLTPPAAA